MPITATLPAVYLLQSDRPEERRAPLAIQPTFYYFEGQPALNRCEWGDTARRSYIFVASVDPIDPLALQDNPPRSFVVHSAEGENLRFSFLTKSLFDDLLKGQVVGHPDFSSDDDVQKFYCTRAFTPC